MNKVVMAPVAQSVEEEVMEAYCDSHPGISWEASIPRRNLNFRASAPVTRDEALRIMAKATPSGYNEFDADKLKLLPEGSMITIARQGSPAMYVTPPIEEAIGEMNADEWDTENGETRIWWD